MDLQRRTISLTALETYKAQERRRREGFFAKYCRGKGLDLGYGGDAVMPDCDVWDIANGDAQIMAGVENESYDYIYSSHLLEHVVDDRITLARWWELLKSKGYLILLLPHRDLYEKRRTLPSRWNADHKRFYLPETDEGPCTHSVRRLIEDICVQGEIIRLATCDAGHTITNPDLHSDGEYSIEVIVRKK